MEGVVASSAPASTQTDTDKPTGQCQTNDVAPFGGEQAMTFSHKMQRGI